ncbi:LysR family transcriptional regulator [Duganella sp. FT80W]|uniref:LysR family transcriptional regulator n=1 Tax=Duganella guangzhouensis TaxID=2666084 RepID=A0A6I2L4L8_9BURK|nr:LysR family transcriptional regulator [Duganella guangzhouensis]MRW92730.1 LysR family transcriptional regulator [Duganella guangzhouensis]
MPQPSTNLNLLRSLDVLLETRNLTLAAEMLGLTQSALSRQLAQLRVQYGDPLLIREGQRFLLTQRAQAMRGPLKAVLASLHLVLDGPGFEPATCSRTFSLAGSDYLAEHMLPSLAEVLHAQAPQARLDFRMWEPGYYRLLSDEGVDLVATIADLLPENLHGRAMGEDRAVCLMRATHPLAGKVLTLADYVAASHLRISGGSDRDGVIEQALAQHGVRRTVRLSVPFFSAALRLLGQQDLLLTVPEHMAIKFASAAPLAWQPLPFDVPAYRYWLLWHARHHHDPAHQWFRQQMFDVLHGFEHGVTHFNAG